MISECSTCGAPVLFQRLYNGHTRAFDPTPHDPAESQLEPRFRWYLSKQRGAIPGDLAGRETADQPFLTIHRCKQTRRGQFESMSPDAAANTPLAVARRTGPFVQDMPLDHPRLAYSYRWPSNWAHIAYRPYHGLCGSRLPEGIRTIPRERERLRGMPVCPDCHRRLPEILEALRGHDDAGAGQ
jgi:hypothetical protein